MKAVALNAAGLFVRNVEKPRCEPDQVLVKIIAGGVCGGDIYAYQTRDKMNEERFLGHEGSGIIEEVGRAVRGYAPGDQVTMLGGRFSEYGAINPALLAKLPPKVDPRWALGEPVACCVHACNRSPVQPGGKVAVIGCGFMGLVCLQLAKAQNPALILALDTIAERLELAQRLGASAGADPRAVSPQQLCQQYGEFDLVIEAAGSQPALDLCGELAGQHGCVNIVGYHQSNGGLRSVNMKLWNFKALTVINGHVRRDDEKVLAMEQGLDLLNRGVLDTKTLASYYELERASEAFQDTLARKPGLIKAVLLPHGAP